LKRTLNGTFPSFFPSFAYQRLTKTGVNGVYYLRGADLLGDDNEGTVDSSHPTDLGFLRQADAFEKELPPLLRH
jgi:hypothetical protein